MKAHWSALFSRLATHAAKLYKKRRGNERQAGFTIIEVVVAVVILALAYTSILQNFSLSLRNIDRADTVQSELFNQQLLFESKLQEMAFSEEEEAPGEIFLEGNRYRVVLVTDESGNFVTLLTEPIR